MEKKTTEQAFKDLKKELDNVKGQIGEALPDWLHGVGRVVRKYRVTALVFYTLAICMIYIGEYPSAIITAIIGIYFSR